MLRTAAALLALMLATSSAARDVTVPPAAGDDMRLREAPVDFPATADLVEVAGGIVYPVLEDGRPSQKATKVPHGVYITAQGYTNIEKSVAREVEALKAENARLKAELALRPEALPGVPVHAPQPEAKKTPTIAKVAGVTLLMVAGAYVGCRGAGGCK